MPALLKELSKGIQEEMRGIDIHSKHAHAFTTSEGMAAMLSAVFSCQ